MKPSVTPDSDRQNPAAGGSSFAKGLGVFAQVIFIAAAAVAVFSFVSIAREGELRRSCGPVCLLRPNYVGADRAAPSFSLRDMQGAWVSLEQFRGRVIVLNFWTKTCAPCMEEMPVLAELAKILRSRSDVVVLAISTDAGPASVRDALKAVLREEPPFTILFDPEFEVVEGKYGTRLYPETWIIDPNGVIRARFDGAREWTSPLIVEWIDQIRNGGYCPIKIEGDRVSGEGATACDSVNGT